MIKSQFPKYSKGIYNKFDNKEQWIRISEGCPNNCKYCRETKENGKDPIYYEIPNIVRNNVKIMDMNLLYKPRAKEIIEFLGDQKVNNKVVYYELICGIDYRYLTPILAQSLKLNRFIKIRLAWDYSINNQKKIKDAIFTLFNVGYTPESITIFMICNYKIPYIDNLKKLDLCKIWGVKVCDCWYDNQTSPHIKPIFWSLEHIKKFRSLCRLHNLMVKYKIDPTLK